MRLCGLIKSLESFLLVGRGIFWWDFEIQVVIYNIRFLWNPTKLMLTPLKISAVSLVKHILNQNRRRQWEKSNENSNILNQRQKKTVRTKSNSWKFHQKRRECFLIGSDVLDKGCPLCGGKCHADCVDTITSKDTSTSFSPTSFSPNSFSQNTSSKKNKERHRGFLIKPLTTLKLFCGWSWKYVIKKTK